MVDGSSAEPEEKKHTKEKDERKTLRDTRRRRNDARYRRGDERNGSSDCETPLLRPR